MPCEYSFPNRFVEQWERGDFSHLAITANLNVMTSIKYGHCNLLKFCTSLPNWWYGIAGLEVGWFVTHARARAHGSALIYLVGKVWHQGRQPWIRRLTSYAFEDVGETLCVRSHNLRKPGALYLRSPKHCVLILVCPMLGRIGYFKVWREGRRFK